MSTYDPTLSDQFFRANGCVVNKSKSKQLYSFGKSERFRNKDLSSCSKSYYDHSDTLTRRGTTIGLGNKTDFTKLFTKTPAPSQYNTQGTLVHHTFSKSQHNFGIGRVTHKLDRAPGPAQYQLNNTFSSIAYSIRPRNDPRIHTDAPGPGTYQTIDTMSPIRQKIAKFMNAPVVLMDTKSSRQLKFKDGNPGPQYYKPRTQMSPNGKYNVSQFRSSEASSFSKEPKLPYPKRLAPGPGTYQIPGEFGFY